MFEISRGPQQIALHEGPSGTTVITVSAEGENTIVYSPGSNAKASAGYVQSPTRIFAVTGMPAGIDHGGRVVYLDADPAEAMEMSKVELAQRIISAETNIPMAALRRADDITPERWNTLNQFWIGQPVDGMPGRRAWRLNRARRRIVR